MHVAFLITRRADAGPARVFLQAARGFAQRGYRVTVACPGQSDVARHAVAHGLDTIELPIRANWLNVVWWLRGALRARGVQSLFVSTRDAERLGAVAQWLGSRALVVRHEATPEEIGVDLPLLDQVAPASRAGLRAPSDDPIVVCWCGVDARIRGIDALRAIARVAARHVGLHAVFAGPGARDDMVRMHAAALHVRGGLTFVSDEATVRRAMCAADVGWVAAEGTDAAFAMLEFMAARVPVLAVDEPVARHILGVGAAGVLVAAGDTPRNAAHLTMLLAQSERRVQLGNAGRARVAQWFTERTVTEPFEVALRGHVVGGESWIAP